MRRNGDAQRGGGGGGGGGILRWLLLSVAPVLATSRANSLAGLAGLSRADILFFSSSFPSLSGSY